MKIKKSLYPFLSLSFTLVACSPQNALQIPPENISAARPIQQTQTVQVIYRHNPEFQTQAVDLSALKFIKLSLVGSGITGSISSDFVTVTGSTATVTLKNVPIQAGHLRVATVQGYDQNKDPLPSFVGKGYYSSQAAVNTVTVKINRRRWITGRVLEQLLQSDPTKANQMNLNQLQTLVDTATGFDANTGFTNDPLLFNITPLLNKLQNTSELLQSDLTNSKVNPTDNVTVTIQTETNGRVIGEVLSLAANDPHSTAVTIPLGSADGSTFKLNVAPGKHLLTIKNASGTVVGGGSVTVNADGSVTTQPELTLNGAVELVLPTVGAVDKAQADLGESVTITGTNLTEVSKVSFNGGEQSHFTNQTATTLTFTVPLSATDGPLNLIAHGQGVEANPNFDVTTTVLFVNAAATGNGSGSSWANAHTTLSAALTAATSGNKILVAEGTYQPVSTLSLKAGVDLIGGFNKSAPEASLLDRDLQTNVTILDGQDARQIASLTSGMVNINGVHFENGNGSSGGALSIGSTATVNLEQISFIKNTASSSAGAIYNAGTMTAKNVIFSNNSSGSGGAIFATGTTTLTDTNFTDNMATTAFGGGIYQSGSANTTVTNVSFTDNSAKYGGGIASASNSELTATNVNFTNNTATTSGGGFYSYGHTVVMTKASFSGNSAGSGGGGLINVAAPFTGNNMIFSNNSANQGGGIDHANAELMTLVNVSFTNNIAPSRGGAIHANNTLMSIVNASFINNTSTSGGGGIANINNSAITSKNMVFWKSTLSGITMPTAVDTLGNIDIGTGTSPFLSAFGSDNTGNRGTALGTLADAQGADGKWFTADDGYLLKTDATDLIDKGIDVSGVTGAAKDILGNTRPVNHGGVLQGTNGTDTDIGAHEADSP